MDIVFTKHAEEKFEALKRHKFIVGRQQVIDAVEQYDIIDESRLPLLIAQKSIDRTHVLRVVYKVKAGVKIVITFYPGRKKHYERQK